MAIDAKQQAIETAIAQIEKAYGKGSIMKMGESIGKKFEIAVIPTGCVPVDLALGVGGLPRGRIAEIFGPEASGKTTLTLSVIAQAQKNGGKAALIDAEHALDPTWAQKVGVNLDDLLISQPDTGEQALEITETLIRSGAIDVVVIDKVAPPFRLAEFDIMGEEGISKEGGLIDVALELGLITKSGAFYRLGAKLIGQGRESAKGYFQEHKKEYAHLEKEIWDKVKKGTPTKPVKVA